MNDLDLCLQVVLRSCQMSTIAPHLGNQKTTNRKWHMGNRMVTCPMTSRDIERSNSWTQHA